MERLGVTRTRQELEGADLTLLVADASAGVVEEDRAGVESGRPVAAERSGGDQLFDGELSLLAEERQSCMFGRERVCPVEVAGTQRGEDAVVQRVFEFERGGGFER